MITKKIFITVTRYIIMYFLVLQAAQKLLNEAAQRMHAGSNISHPETDTTSAKVDDLGDSQGVVDTGTEALDYNSLHS